ncbi:putative monothiol glutaredoxin-4 [Venturia nashicola]|nr:putative monothiol glutaredoxin-4 [Venturia nashicola]
MASSDPVKVTAITNDAEFDQLASSFPPSALLVVYFHAPWAEPCKQMSTILEALASTYTVSNPPTIGFVSLDAEELPEISEKYDVSAVPYIVLQKDGKTLDTISGSDASKVRAAVEKHAGKSGDSGKLGLPPAQQFTKPAGEAPVPENGASSSTKDLSSYAPSSNEPATAPEYSSSLPSKEELNKRLSELVKAAPVMLFMKGTPSAPQCGFSRQTVALLRERSIRYGFFNILADDEVRQGLKEFSDWPTFPQLYADGELVGGLDIVKEEFENNPDFLMEYAVQKAAPSTAA